MEAKLDAAHATASNEEPLGHGKESRLKLLMLAEGFDDECSKIVDGPDLLISDAHLEANSPKRGRITILPLAHL